VASGGLAVADMTQPIALVAGASRGLGLLIARELGASGYRLVICARNASELERAADDLRERGCEVSTQVCDVADNDAVTALLRSTEDEVGPIDVLICVAGVIQVGPLAALNRSHFEDAVSIMLWGPINTALGVAGPMRQRRRGRIGIVSSIGGLVSVPHLLPYSTAKFGAVGFARGLRAELAGTGVSVTTITPGLMRTGSHYRAKFVGHQAAELAWFGAGAALPGISMDAERAARRIVDAVLAGKAQLVLTPLAHFGMRLNGVAPNLTAVFMNVAGRVLPKAPAQSDGTTLEGWEAEDALRPGARRLFRSITVLGARAADRFNQGRSS